jgi:small subunit ribosomal protein S20
VSGLDVSPVYVDYSIGGRNVANIKSAKKRILVSERNAERNKAIKSGVKTSVKKVYSAIESGDKAAAQSALTAATKSIDMATSKGVYHKNTSSRKVSRMAQAVNKMD